MGILVYERYECITEARLALTKLDGADLLADFRTG
jgi:hypothetical protein